MIRNTALAYLISATALSVAVLLRWLLDPWLGNDLPLHALYPAVALAVWMSGYRPAMLVAILGYIVCDWLFQAPRGELGIDGIPDLVALGFYVTSCSIIIGFGEAMLRA